MAYMTDDITIIKYDTEDIYNEPTATSSVTVKGKIEYKTRLLSDIKGQEVVAGKAAQVMSSASVLLPENIDVSLGRDLSHEDRLKFNDVEHKILQINTPKAFGNYFVFKYEVFVA